MSIGMYLIIGHNVNVDNYEENDFTDEDITDEKTSIQVKHEVGEHQEIVCYQHVDGFVEDFYSVVGSGFHWEPKCYVEDVNKVQGNCYPNLK